jgi:hypothetical protein
LKTKVFSRFLYLLLAMLLLSFSDPYTIKRISDLNFRYEFYTTDKIVKPKEGKMYYWFKGGLIHNVQGGMGGLLLDGKYIKMYHSNQLAEQGEFKNGLKVGLWKTWHPNGKIQTIQYWGNGLRSGNYYCYDENGVMTVKGKFNHDIQKGKWIDYTKQDTLVYRKGIVVVKKPKVSKVEKFKLNQEAIIADRKKKTEEDLEKLQNENTLVSYKVKAKEDEKTYKENKKILNQKLAEDKKILKEKRKAAKKAEEEQKAAKGGSKVKVFFKKVWNKIKPKQKKNAKSS